jgi:hypothetical protein
VFKRIGVGIVHALSGITLRPAYQYDGKQAVIADGPSGRSTDIAIGQATLVRFIAVGHFLTGIRPVFEDALADAGLLIWHDISFIHEPTSFVGMGSAGGVLQDAFTNYNHDRRMCHVDGGMSATSAFPGSSETV